MRLYLGLGALIVWLSLVGGRISFELRDLERGGLSRTAIGSRWDPRGRDRLDALVRRRESESFKIRLARGLKASATWPGLRSAQLSWTWLEMLSGVANPASYEGDFSWIFSKLYDVLVNSNPKEVAFLRSLAPFYFVLGKDHAGANILLEELLRRNPGSFQTWFWGGFHAMENLYLPKMAAYFYEESAGRPMAPAYLSALALRLKIGSQAFENTEQRRRMLGEQMDPETLERIKRVRPEWFE